MDGTSVSTLPDLPDALSARRRVTWAQAAWILALGAGATAAIVYAPERSLYGAHAAFVLLFLLCIGLRLLAAAAALGAVNARQPMALPAQLPLVSVLLPLYREAAQLPALLDALAAQTYPADRLDILILLEADDLETQAAAARLANPRVRVVIVPPGGPRTKPNALNWGMAHAAGVIIAVYDAEDRPAPTQIAAAVAAFEAGGADLGAVQAPLVIDNGAASWISRQFAAEYAIHFGQMLPFLAAGRLPIPLGGSSNFIKARALREVGAWDAWNVTEDADLGCRLAVAGWRTACITPPTFEEAPVTLTAWLKQRTRWIKGHIQTWLVLMRRPGSIARQLGGKSAAMLHLVLAGGVMAAFAHGPLLVYLGFTLLTIGAAGIGLEDWLIMVAGYAIAAYAAAVATACSARPDALMAAPTMPLYWALSTVAAVRALLDLVVRPHYWSKTDHGVSLRQTPNFAGAKAHEPRYDDHAGADGGAWPRVRADFTPRGAPSRPAQTAPHPMAAHADRHRLRDGAGVGSSDQFVGRNDRPALARKRLHPCGRDQAAGLSKAGDGAGASARLAPPPAVSSATSAKTNGIVQPPPGAAR